MLVEPFSYQSIAWPDCDLAQLIGRQHAPVDGAELDHPLSIVDLRRLFARYFESGCRILVPELWGDDIKNFSPAKRFTARLYNMIIRLRASRAALTFVAPFFRIVARKADVGGDGRRLTGDQLGRHEGGGAGDQAVG